MKKGPLREIWEFYYEVNMKDMAYIFWITLENHCGVGI